MNHCKLKASEKSAPLTELLRTGAQKLIKAKDKKPR